jgi:DNA invertase Pin-like site-specific DNA recombinase
MLAIGYARVSTDAEDLAGQRAALMALGVPRDCIYVDRGMTDRERPGLRAAFDACRPGDTLVVTKLHRLAHSLADAKEIGIELARRGVALDLGGVRLHPGDPKAELVYRTLVVLSDFETDVVRSRTREGMKAARAKGRLRGKPPKLDAEQQRRLVDLHHNMGHSPEDLAEMFGVARATVYRVLDRARRGAIAVPDESHQH